MKSIRCFSAVALLLLPLYSISEDKVNSPYYISVFVGPSSSGRVGGEFPETNARNTSVYGAAIGYKFNDHFRSDLSIENRNNYRVNNTAIDDEGDDYKYEQNLKVNSLSTMVNLYYDINNFYRFTPYVVGGIGASYNRVYNASISTITEDGATITSISNGHKTNLATKIGLGIKYEINKNFDLNLQYHYVNLGSFKTGSIVTYASGESENEIPKTENLNTKEFIVNATYKF